MNKRRLLRQPVLCGIRGGRSRDAFLNQFEHTHLRLELRQKVETPLCHFEEIFASHGFDLGQIEIATHTIKILHDSAPVYCRPFRCSEHESEELHWQLELMLKHGPGNLFIGGLDPRSAASRLQSA